MFEEVLKADSQSDEAYVGLAKCYYEQGMNVHAEEALELAMKMPLKSKYLYVDIGWCYCDMGRQKKAEEMFKKRLHLGRLIMIYILSWPSFIMMLNYMRRRRKCISRPWTWLGLKEGTVGLIALLAGIIWSVTCIGRLKRCLRKR